MNEMPHPDNISLAAKEALISLNNCKGILHKGSPQTFLLESICYKPLITAYPIYSSPQKSAQHCNYNYYNGTANFNQISNEFNGFHEQKVERNNVEAFYQNGLGGTVKKQRHFSTDLEESPEKVKKERKDDNFQPKEEVMKIINEITTLKKPIESENHENIQSMGEKIKPKKPVMKIVNEIMNAKKNETFNKNPENSEIEGHTLRKEGGSVDNSVMKIVNEIMNAKKNEIFNKNPENSEIEGQTLRKEGGSEDNSPEFNFSKAKTQEKTNNNQDESTKSVDHNTIKKLYEDVAKKDILSTVDKIIKSDDLIHQSHEKSYSFSKEIPQEEDEKSSKGHISSHAERKLDETNILLKIYQQNTIKKQQTNGKKTKKMIKNNKNTNSNKNPDVFEVAISKKRTTNSQHSNQKPENTKNALFINELQTDMKQKQESEKKTEKSIKNTKTNSLEKTTYQPNQQPGKTDDLKAKADVCQIENRPVDEFSKEILKLLAERDRVWTQNRIRAISACKASKEEMQKPKNLNKKSIKTNKNPDKNASTPHRPEREIREKVWKSQVTREKKKGGQDLMKNSNSIGKPALNPMKLFNILNKYIHIKSCPLGHN